MPRYFFNFDHDTGQDDDGVELSRPLDACQEAACLVGHMMKDDPEQLVRSGRWMLTVIDEEHRAVLELTVLARQLE